MTARKINWGILSTASIGTEKVIPAMRKSASSNVLGIASRSAERAAQEAQRLSIPRSYDSYEDMLADPDIDAIYNPLPNDLHVEWTLKAARAGKHVLCEKPVGLTADDALRLRDAPDGVLIAEAFMIRHHPQWLRLREMAQSGELGEVRAVQAAFSYFNTDPGDIRNTPENGGGAMLDIGCYPVTGARFVFDAEPRRVVALIDRDPEFRTDRLAGAICDFGDGRLLTFQASTQMVPFQTFQVFGTKARAEILIPFNAPQGEETTIVIDDGRSLDASSARRETLPACDQYAEQAEAFARSILTHTPAPYGVEDAIASMRILDAMFESERTAGWINL